MTLKLIEQKVEDKHLPIKYNKKITHAANLSLSRAFLGRPAHTSNSRKHYHGWHQVDKFSKFVPIDILKMLIQKQHKKLILLKI